MYQYWTYAVLLELYTISEIRFNSHSKHWSWRFKRLLVAKVNMTINKQHNIFIIFTSSEKLDKNDKSRNLQKQSPKVWPREHKSRNPKIISKTRNMCAKCKVPTILADDIAYIIQVDTFSRRYILTPEKVTKTVESESLINYSKWRKSAKIGYVQKNDKNRQSREIRKVGTSETCKYAKIFYPFLGEIKLSQFMNFRT